MNDIVNSRIRTLLVQSLHSVEAHQDELRRALGAALARTEQDPELSDTPDLVATLLLSFLTEQARHIVEEGEPRNLGLYRAEYGLHGIAGRHYSRFGDALIAALKDTLGPMHPSATAFAWCDAYWGLVQRMQQDEDRGGLAPATRTAEQVA